MNGILGPLGKVALYNCCGACTLRGNRMTNIPRTPVAMWCGAIPPKTNGFVLHHTKAHVLDLWVPPFILIHRDPIPKRLRVIGSCDT